MNKKKEPTFQSGEMVDEKRKGYYGMAPEQSLLSVNFSTSENTYLNEHDPDETKETDNESTF